MDKSKKQLIFTRINELFAKIVETKNSPAFAKFLRFIRKFNHRSPFNNALVFAQNPDCFYWATEREWEKMGRKVKENARPMVILFPFGPVEFVYDYKDTEGKEITEDRLIYWWKEKPEARYKLYIDSIFNKTIDFLKKINIEVEVLKKGIPKEYLFYDKSIGIAQHIREAIFEKRKIILHQKYQNKEDIKEAYATLVHEIAHHFLGHLGKLTIEKTDTKGGKKYKKIADDRSFFETNIQELEAELTAWIVFSLFGLEKRSEEYMAMYLIDKQDFSKINFSLVFTTAWKIREIGMGNFKV